LAVDASRLTSAHLPDLLKLEGEYPPEYRLGEGRLRQKLTDLERSGCSLGHILHKDGECVAYIVGYPQFSRLEQRAKERVIYVDDIFVQKGLEVLLFRLIKLFTEEAVRLGMRDCPIEGVCRVSAYRAFVNHDSLLRRLGWELSKKSEYWDETVKEEMCWLRWEPLYAQEAVLNTDDRITVDVDDEEDFYEPVQKLVTLEDTEQYAYQGRLTTAGPEPDDEEEDEYRALTEVMLGSGDEELVAIIPAPPVDLKELKDVFGIREFFGTKRASRKQRIIREQ